MIEAITPLELWPARIEAVIARSGGLFKRVFVLRETDSTQDAARRQRARPGDVVVAWRQTAGRGRLGRAWADTGEEGVAATLVVPRGSPERLAIVAAIAAALAVESVLQRSVGIKWPNDVLVNARKLAGVLIEQVDDVALIGVGINVRQRSWPNELAQRAISLAQLGVACDRLAVVEALISSMTTAIRMDDDEIAATFARRDVLCGKQAAFLVAGEALKGRIVSIDPMRGLRVRSYEGERWLSAASTTLAASSLAAATAQDR
jgi:BirA family biotin operon repressor/biotin-[acetyl-CoA-carboxylase] ligase